MNVDVASKVKRPEGRARNREGEGSMGSRNLTDTATPAGVMAMMAQGTAKPVPPAAPQPLAESSSNEQGNANGGTAPQAPAGKPQVDYSVSYKDWSTVSATARKGTEDQITFVFKRDGLWSWKLAGVKLPVDKLSAN